MNIQDTPLQNVEVNTIEQTTSMYDDTPLNDTTGIGESLTSSIEHVEKQREVIAEEQRLENIDNASIGDKYFGMSSTFDGSDIGGVIDWFKYDRGYFQEKDEKFLNGFNKNTEDMVLKSFSLNESSRPYIQEAKNYEHLISLATKEQLRTEALKNVMNVYSDTENLVSNLLVGLATDPSVVLTGGASGLIRGSAILARSSKVTKALSSMAKVEETGKALKVSSQAEQMASSTIKTLTDKAQQQARTQAALMVVNDMKEGLAKAVVGSSIAYGAVLGATQEDTSMIEGLLAYGLLSPIDYKIINGIKVLDIAPRTIGIGKNTVDSMHENTLRIGRNSNKNDLTIIPKSSNEYLKPFKVTQDELVKIEHNINSIKNISNIEKEELKNAIRARLRVNNSSGFKNLVLKIKSIESEIKYIESKKKLSPSTKSKQLSVNNTLVDDIHDIGRDIEVSISGFNKTLKEVGTSGKAYDDIVDDVLSMYKSLKDTGHLSNSAYNKLITHRKNGAKFINPKIEINHTVKKNGESFAEVKINGKIVAVLGASALAASGLGAYDGGDLVSDSGNIIGLAILSLFLGAGVRQALKSRAVRKALEESEGIVNKSKAFDDTRSIRASIGEFFNSSRNGLMETIDPILKNTTGAVHDLAKIMYFNPLDQTAKTIETTKRIFAKSKSEGLEKELRDTFSSWLKNTDNSTIDNISSMFTDISLRAKYNKMVWEHMTMGKHSDNIDVVNGAKNVDKYNKQVRKDMKESGVANADKMIHAEDGLYYVPRINKGLEFANKITGISDISKKGLINTFAKMLVNTPDARKMIVAEEYINNMIKRNINPSKTFSKDARESIKKELSIKGLSEDEIDEVISSISGEYGRTKARLFMDYSKFGTFKADINGVSIPITIDDIFITDISSCSNTLFNQAGGHVAFATNGFKSVDDAISIVNDANILENHRAILLNDIGAMIGIPAIDYSQTANVVFKNLGNMATGSMMKLSTISLMSEGIIYIANTLRQSGLIDGMKNLSNSVRKFGDDSFIASDIPFGKDGLGLGQSKYGATYGQFRTFDEFSNQHSGIGKFTRFTEMWRDFTLHTLPFSRTSDFLAKANLQDVLDRLYKHFSGELPLKDHELSAFPITDRMREYLMKSMSLNKEGHVKFFDYTTESFGLKDEFKNLIDNMMMKRMNASTMGTTGAFVRQSAVGVGMSAMLKYPMSAYANLGGFLGRGAMQGDAFAMTQIALWFQAGIVQAIIRNEIQGKDYDDNDLIIAGLSNMPQYGIIGTITGLGESPTSNMAADITNILDIYSYVNK